MNPWRTVNLVAGLMEALNLGNQLSILGGGLAQWSVDPVVVAALGDPENGTWPGDGMMGSIRPNKGVLHLSCFAKYTDAFFRISTSSRSRSFSSCSRESSLCSLLGGRPRLV